MRPVLTDEEVATFRAEVCRVSESLFARHGVEGVTMRQIAAELGCSSTTAYRYFKNKDEILTAVRAAAFHRFCDVLEQAASSSTDPRAAARNVGNAYLSFALASPDAYRMMFDVSQVAATENSEVTDALNRARRTMVGYLTPLFDLGLLQGDVYALGQILWAAAHGLVMLRLSGIVDDDTELWQLHKTTMSAVVRGARTPALAESTPKRKRPVPTRRPLKQAF